MDRVAPWPSPTRAVRPTPHAGWTVAGTIRRPARRAPGPTEGGDRSWGEHRTDFRCAVDDRAADVDGLPGDLANHFERSGVGEAVAVPQLPDDLPPWRIPDRRIARPAGQACASARTRGRASGPEWRTRRRCQRVGCRGAGNSRVGLGPAPSTTVRLCRPRGPGRRVGGGEGMGPRRGGSCCRSGSAVARTSSGGTTSGRGAGATCAAARRREDQRGGRPPADRRCLRVSRERRRRDPCLSLLPDAGEGPDEGRAERRCWRRSWMPPSSPGSVAEGASGESRTAVEGPDRDPRRRLRRAPGRLALAKLVSQS